MSVMHRAAYAAVLVALILMSSARVLAAPGDELWMDQFDASGGFDFSPSVAVSGSRVVVAGELQPGGGDLDFLVRALDARTGGVLWSSAFDLDGGDDSASAVAIKGKRVFAAGSGETLLGGDDVLVRAYEVKTGALLWSDRYDLAGGDDRATAVAVKGRLVFVAAEVENASGDDDFLLRAYNGRDGALVWQDRFDLAGLGDRPRDLVVKGNTVVIGGQAQAPTTAGDLLVRAYAARDGTFLWQNQHDVGGFDDDLREMAVLGRRLFIAATVVPAGAGSDMVVRALNVRTGAFEWQHAWTLPASGDAARGIAASGGRVFVVGSHGAPGNTFLAVRALAARDGSILWDDVYDAEGLFDSGGEAVVRGRNLYVVGTTTSAATGNDQLVRTYDANSGNLLWDDVFDIGDNDGTWGVALKGRRIFVLGDATDTNPGSDITVRALEAR